MSQEPFSEMRPPAVVDVKGPSLDAHQSQPRHSKLGGIEDGHIPHASRGRRARPPMLPFLLVLAAAVGSFLLLPPGAIRALGLAAQPSCGTPAAAAAAAAPQAQNPLGEWVTSNAAAAVDSADVHASVARRPLYGIPARVVGRLRTAVQSRQLNPFPLPFPAPRRRVVECLQVEQTVLRPADDGARNTGLGPTSSDACSVVLMDHVFGLSYGKPFVGNYTPPACDFNRVAMNFTVVSENRQFDRLAIMYLNDTEVWRTSTAEPVAPPGIRWEYNKDMTPYLSFWKTPQKLIFDLGNLIDDTYNGTFNATLTATFFRSGVRTAAAPPADLIIPITGRNASQAVNPVSAFVIPQQKAETTVADFPRNANRAVLSVSACGQASEEFWWSNFLESDVASFNDTSGMANGLSPFREVQALIDGRLAGVTWPFPVIFTGGVVPSLHRPVVGLQAFDLREHEIDITPWLPLLCDGKPHSVSFTISGLLNDGSKGSLSNKVNMNWPITGKIFVWLDEAGSVTTGTAPEVQGADPTVKLAHQLYEDAQGRNQSLTYTVGVQRDFTVTSTVVTKGSTRTSTWRQRLSFVTEGNVTSYGETQEVNFSVTGSETASANQTAVYGHDYRYPLAVTMQTVTDAAGALSLSASMGQGLVLQTSGAAVYPDGLEAFGTSEHGVYAASILSTSRDGVATFRQSADKRSTSGSGQTTQEFAFGGNFQRYPDLSSDGGVGSQPDVMLYYRNISTDGNNIVRDRITVADSALGPVQSASVVGLDRQDGEFAALSRQVIMTPPTSPGSSTESDVASAEVAEAGVRFGPFLNRMALR